MEDLVNSKSGLIQLRGKWVMADKQVVSQVSGYMDALREKSLARKKKELEQLAATAEIAKQLGEPGWEALMADVERRRQEFNEGGEEHEQVTVAELRELALESMTQEPIEFTGSTWHTALLGGVDKGAPERVDIPTSVHAELREYQRRGVDWLYWMSRNGIGAVLADDMGLGKTLQLLTLLAVEKDRGEQTGPCLLYTSPSPRD